jgi:hypothetical protein
MVSNTVTAWRNNSRQNWCNARIKIKNPRMAEVSGKIFTDRYSRDGNPKDSACRIFSET